MVGPMRLYEVDGYLFLKEEIKPHRKFVWNGKKVLEVCLGENSFSRLP